MKPNIHVSYERLYVWKSLGVLSNIHTCVSIIHFSKRKRWNGFILINRKHETTFCKRGKYTR